MTTLEWDDDLYSVGIKRIDDQHKILVQLINALFLHREKPDKAFIERIFNTLISYISEHFRDEEVMLRNMHFPNYSSHKEQHLRFEKSVQGYRKAFLEKENSEEVLTQILDYLQKWLLSHIVIEDRKYVSYLFEGMHEPKGR